MIVSAQVLSLTAVVILLSLCMTSVEGNRRHRQGHRQHNRHRNAQHQESPEESSYGCGEDEYTCRGPLEYCIPLVWKCDSDPDCPQEDDEANCPPTAATGCSRHDFLCRDGTCIPTSWRCDGDIDCPDRSDEQSCNSGLQVNSGHLGNSAPRSRPVRQATFNKRK